MSAPWSGRRILLTGHTGFKGAWLALWLERLGATVIGASLPADEAAGAYRALGPRTAAEEYQVDLRDPDGVQKVVARSGPDLVFHLAAQALVRRSYQEPAATYATNVLGTVHLLEALASLESVPPTVVVTSDKVYASPDPCRPCREDDPLGGVDPYSASKACVEIVAASFRSRFGSPLATARAGNVLGGGDRAEDRLLPDVRRAIEAGRPVPLRFPDATRPWQHVLDPLWGYLLLAESLVERPSTTPPAVNFGPRPHSCLPVADVVERACQELGTGSWERAPGFHPHESPSLMLDASLAEQALGWQPRLDVDRAVRWTVAWWLAENDGDDLRALATAQIDEYTGLLGG